MRKFSVMISYTYCLSFCSLLHLTDRIYRFGIWIYNGNSKKLVIPANNSVISRDDIRTDNGALYCITNDVTCCGTSPCRPESYLPGSDGCGNERGGWYSPADNNKGIEVPSSTNQSSVWYNAWLTGAVSLNYRGNGSNGITGHHRCAFKNNGEDVEELFICIYDDGVNDEKCKLHSSVLVY